MYDLCCLYFFLNYECIVVWCNWPASCLRKSSCFLEIAGKAILSWLCQRSLIQLLISDASSAALRQRLNSSRTLFFCEFVIYLRTGPCHSDQLWISISPSQCYLSVFILVEYCRLRWPKVNEKLLLICTAIEEHLRAVEFAPAFGSQSGLPKRVRSFESSPARTARSKSRSAPSDGGCHEKAQSVDTRTKCSKTTRKWQLPRMAYMCNNTSAFIWCPRFPQWGP